MLARGPDGEKLNTLLRDEWELYDTHKMRWLKVAAVAMLLPLLWVLVYLLVHVVASKIVSAGPTLGEEAALTTAITLALALLIIGKVRQMDRAKANWHFAALQDARLVHEETLALARGILTKRGYAFEERTRRTITLFITYWDVKANDFSMRVWFSRIVNPSIVEVGFGPENSSNRERVRELRSATSGEFLRRYGTAA